MGLAGAGGPDAGQRWLGDGRERVETDERGLQPAVEGLCPAA